MVILHIASILDDKFNGVCVAVPQHVISQSKIENVGFMNLNDYRIEGCVEQFFYSKYKGISNLPSPFNKPDIVVFHEAYRTKYLALYKELKKKQIPYVIIPHGELSAEAQKKKWLKKKIANMLLFNRFIKGAVAIQALSNREMEAIRFNVFKFVGTNGINMPKRKKEKFHLDETKFVYIGRLDAYHKGLDLLIEAVGKKLNFLKKNHCSIYIYGPDYQGRYANLERLIKEHGVGSVVHLSHEVSGTEKEKILLDADVFVQTSRFEGMPMGILEALSYGIPCLVTEGTTLKSPIEKYDLGWGADVNVDSVAESIERVICEQKSWINKGQNARTFIQEEFIWEKIAKDTVGKYKDLCV